MAKSKRGGRVRGKSTARGRRARRRGGGPTSSMTSEVVRKKLVNDICALTDPFCGHSIGALYPSQAAQPTVPYRAVTQATLFTGTSGWGVFILSPNNTSTKIFARTALNTVPYTCPTPDSYVGQTDTVAGNVSRARIVSVGVRLWDISPATSEGGAIVASFFNGTTVVGQPLYAGTPLGVNPIMADRRRGVTAICTPVNINAREFVADFSTVYDAETRWSSVVIEYSGTPSSAVMMAEIIVNYEFILKPITGIPATMTHKQEGTAASYEAAAIANQVYDRLEPAREGVAEKMSKAIEALAVQGVRKLAVQFGNTVGGPAGAAFAATFF